MQSMVKIKQPWQIICLHISALSEYLNQIYLGISHAIDMLRKMLSGFLNVMLDTEAKLLSYNITLYYNTKVLLWGS